ncbi:MAG TPA: ATP-dependent metallopeptidase FtsH/Yme1/Tma family protein [Egibacteraceae bacterium]|nr:ATP-dependent metallopeptidase FtsH/Yme1/Tma family protein [Actinomycetota bacterium]HWB72077.1 ATP-dependent metallopeptidase FtsH/Yme1/Tma family protein [Egibacteraceae bacterium]
MSTNGGGKPGLAWPAHDSGPTPPPEYRSRQRDDERATRRPLVLWDRIKLLLLLAICFAVLLSNTVSTNPIIGWNDAVNATVRSAAWLLLLAALEIVRQTHYLVSEHWAGYHRFWSRRVFGAFERRAGRMNDWTRFRVGRALKIAFYLLVLDLVLAALFDLPAATALLQAPAIFFGYLPLVLQLAFGFFFVIVQFIGLFWFLSRGGSEVYFPDDIKTRFSDVWGQDNVLAKIKENMVFLEDPESIEEKGGYVPGGILLWGPPGTGKTLMAEAVAGETGRPFIFVDPGAFINMFMGVGILKVKSLFRKARKLALRYGGVIMFFDEADSLGSRGQLAQGGLGGQGMNVLPWAAASCNGLAYLEPHTSALLLSSGEDRGDGQRRGVRDRIIMGGMGGGGMGTLNALLTELSGLKKPRGFWNRVVRRALGMRPKPPPKYRIMVMMATNLPQALDEALLRPGRIDRIYKVGYPSKAGRIRTYLGYLAKVRHTLAPQDVDKLATITPYATGATIKDLVNEALINAIRDGRDAITWRDVVKAKQLKELGPSEDVEYIERERHAVAVHEACHAVVAYRVRHHLTIDIATIEKGGTYLGMVASIPPEDQFTRWRSEYEADIMVSLASLAGERAFFEGDNSSGVSGDLESATRVATMMEGFWGMGSTVTSHGVTRQAGIPGGSGKPGGDDKETELLKSDLGERIETKLKELLERTERLLADNRREVFAVAHALETNKTVTGDDVKAIIDGMPGPLIDGRAYHSDEFLQAAEAYHALVVAAHQRHAKVEAPLPALAAVGTLVGDGVSGDGDRRPPGWQPVPPPPSSP